MKNNLYINTEKEVFPVAEDLYGLFFEDINRAGDGGLYPEMIRNRSFEDSLIPSGCEVDKNREVYINSGGWPGAFNNGEGMDEWAASVPYTDIPGWYSRDTKISLEKNDTLNKKREVALKAEFSDRGIIYNVGYSGMSIKKGEEYNLYIFIKTKKPFNLDVYFEGSDGLFYSSVIKRINVDDDWQRVDFKLVSIINDNNAKLVFKSDIKNTVLFGFCSLMPKDTYMGHGLRKDLVLMLKNLHPRFLRFPGGCVVEGISKETAMRFSNTIGPVWERPSHQLMWHYRTSNGLGYHEFLQLCEDLNIEAMYVTNVGMTCQARNGELFTMKETEEILEDALNALEYALGEENSFYGGMRVKAGHSEPFKMKYLEIGNENFGDEYNKRYELFYKAIKEKYPEIIIISNSHTEKSGLTTEYVDEHFYNTPEFFLENDDIFDNYDRLGPKIFIGEYAVNGGKTISSMECALAEAVFLLGMERNQDIVKLSAYAPLFQNQNYSAWKPNLIVFNNHQVYGIPSYHALSLLGEFRGDFVVESKAEVVKRPPLYCGLPGVIAKNKNISMKNVRINGKAVDEKFIVYGEGSKEYGNSHHFTGKSETFNNAFEKFIREINIFGMGNELESVFHIFGTEELTEYTFEIDLKFSKDNEVTLSSWNQFINTDAGCNEPREEGYNYRKIRNQNWKITNITDEEFNTYKVTADSKGFDVYINNQFIERKEHKLHPVVYQVATVKEDEIYVKIVNVADEKTSMEINLDVEIEDYIKVKSISGDLTAINDFRNKNRIAPKSYGLINGAKSFVFEAEKNSVNVLQIRRRK